MNAIWFPFLFRIDSTINRTFIHIARRKICFINSIFSLFLRVLNGDNKYDSVRCFNWISYQNQTIQSDFNVFFVYIIQRSVASCEQMTAQPILQYNKYVCLQCRVIHSISSLNRLSTQIQNYFEKNHSNRHWTTKKRNNFINSPDMLYCYADRFLLLFLSHSFMSLSLWIISNAFQHDEFFENKQILSI